GSLAAGHRRLGGHPAPEGGSGHEGHPGHRAHRARPGERPRQSPRRGLQRGGDQALPAQGSRAGGPPAARGTDRCAGGGNREAMSPAAKSTGSGSRKGSAKKPAPAKKPATAKKAAPVKKVAPAKKVPPPPAKKPAPKKPATPKPARGPELIPLPEAPRAVDNRSGKYVYCIIQTTEPRRFGHIGIGSDPTAVHTVSYKDIAAVVSDTPLEVYDPTRENVLAHERVNEAVMRDFTVIPMSFSTVFKTSED